MILLHPRNVEHHVTKAQEAEELLQLSSAPEFKYNDCEDIRNRIIEIRKHVQGERDAKLREHFVEVADIRNAYEPLVVALRNRESKLRRAMDIVHPRHSTIPPDMGNGNRRGMLSQIMNVLKQWR